jgi:hypothetical protein
VIQGHYGNNVITSSCMRRGNDIIIVPPHDFEHLSCCYYQL